MGAAYSSLGQIKVLHATSLVLLGAKAKFLQGNLVSSLLWRKLLKCVDIRDGYVKVFC